MLASADRLVSLKDASVRRHHFSALLIFLWMSVTPGGRSWVEDEDLLLLSQICCAFPFSFTQISLFVRGCDSQLRYFCPENHLLGRRDAAAAGACTSVWVCVWLGYNRKTFDPHLQCIEYQVFPLKRLKMAEEKFKRQ